jgi:hypothetical protein
VDLTGVFPFVGLMTDDFTAGQTVIKAPSNKVAKHEKTCSDNQHVFISFTFPSTGCC